MRSATSEMLDTLRKCWFEILEQNKPTKEGNKAEQIPMKIGGLMADDAVAQALKQGGHGIQHKPLPAVTKHAHVVEHRRKEDAVGQKDFDNVFHVAEEKTDSGHDRTNPHAEQDHGREQHRNPQKIDGPANLYEK